ncbi:MAG: hypothetical protein GX875_07590 [Propionibacterium sp.]|nr:hypothetical protein [Propionibacterium sp.]
MTSAKAQLVTWFTAIRLSHNDIPSGGHARFSALVGVGDEARAVGREVPPVLWGGTVTVTVGASGAAVFGMAPEL